MKKIFQSLHWYHVLLAVVSVQAIFTFVILLRQSVRLDEAQTLWAVSKSYLGMLEHTAQDVHVPLYYSLVFIWVRLFGSDVSVVRVLSIVLWALTLPVIYFLTKYAFHRPQLRLAAVILFMSSPFLMWYSAESRMYSLFIFIVSLTHLFFFHWYEKPTPHNRVKLGIALMIGMYTHYFFWLVMGAQAFFLLFMATKKLITEKWRAEFQWWWGNIQKGLEYGVISGTAALVFIPWVLFIISQGSLANTKPLLSMPTPETVLQLGLQFLFGIQPYAWQGVLIALWPLTVMAVFIFFTRKHHLQLQHSWYWLMLTVLPIIVTFSVSYFSRPILVPRYLIFIAGSFFILLTWLVTTLSEKHGMKLITAVIILMGISTAIQNYSSLTPVKEEYAQVSEYVAQVATTRDLVAVSAPFTIYPIEYSYHGVAGIETVPYWNRYEVGALPQFSWDEVYSQLEGYRQRYQRLYLILSYDQGYEENIKSLADNAFTFVESRQFSPELELRVYQIE